MNSTASNPFRPGHLAPSMIPAREDMVAVLEEMEAAILTQMGGPLPEYPDLARVDTVLDLSCGSGEWIVGVAPRNTHLSFTGVDSNPRLIGYARDRARTLKLLEQVQFRTFDVTTVPWPLESDSFDLVNAQFMQVHLRADDWVRVLHECLRVLRPGGWIRLTEAEATITNSPAYEQLQRLLVQVLQQDGHSFSGQSNGITHMLSHFLVQAGFQEIERTPHNIDYSATSEGHHRISDVMLRLFAPSLFGQELVQRGLLSAEAYQTLYEAVIREVWADDFCACTYFLTVSGQKR